MRIGLQSRPDLDHLAFGKSNVRDRVELLRRIDHPSPAQDQINHDGYISEPQWAIASSGGKAQQDIELRAIRQLEPDPARTAASIPALEFSGPAVWERLAICPGLVPNALTPRLRPSKQQDRFRPSPIAQHRLSGRSLWDSQCRTLPNRSSLHG